MAEAEPEVDRAPYGDGQPVSLGETDDDPTGTGAREG